jgi:hypothetical protein
MEATSKEGEDIWQYLQENHRAGDQKANRRVDWAIGNESLDIVEESAPSKTKEEMSKAEPLERTKTMAVHLDWLAPSQETTWGKWPQGRSSWREVIARTEPQGRNVRLSCHKHSL